ncbi:MAG: right-handed parallel beta-helix repeat-containing protein, partial [Chloroflexales bacterium]|nr:right-handed parallel beta-helix repeat-containing protein [Chloroflexales bacterium]
MKTCNRSLRMLLAGALVAVLVTLAWPALAQAATIAVNTTADEINADGDCSLREALTAANTDVAVDACPAGSGADSITLPAGTYTLTIAGSGAAAGDLDITDDLMLVGSGPLNTIIDANGLDRVFAISSESVANISNVTISGGNSGIAGGSGIYVNNSTATLTRVRVSNNVPNGGIFLVGTASLTVVDSRVEQNTGHGIAMQSTTTATILYSTISGNTADDTGGGIISNGTLTVVNSTISGNMALNYGGGIASSGATSLLNVTIANNTANSDANAFGTGGGVYIYGGGVLRARNTLIGGNADNSSLSPDPDCSGTLTSEGYNLIENTSGCVIAGSAFGNITGITPILGPLQNNGGPTFTHALLAGSPAIDAGNALGCADQNAVDLTTDQRGFLRTALCDMGAYEYNSPGAPPPTNTPTRTRTPTPTATATRSPTATNSSTPTASPSPTRTATAATTSTPANALTATATSSITPS